MSESQMSALKQWMLDKKAADNKEGAVRPKFVAAPAIFLPRTWEVAQGAGPEAALRSDSWDGYPAQFHELLVFIAHEEINGLVFLGGDAHLPFLCTSKLTKPNGQAVTVRCIHTGALYAPYPIANAIPEDFAKIDKFEARADGRTADCEITKVSFPEVRDGITLIETLPPQSASASWSMAVDFYSSRTNRSEEAQVEF